MQRILVPQTRHLKEPLLAQSFEPKPHMLCRVPNLHQETQVPKLRLGPRELLVCSMLGPGGLLGVLALAKGWASFRLRGGGGRYSPLTSPSPKKGSIHGPPKILPRVTPGPGGDQDPKFSKKMKMGILESAR